MWPSDNSYTGPLTLSYALRRFRETGGALLILALMALATGWLIHWQRAHDAAEVPPSVVAPIHVPPPSQAKDPHPGESLVQRMIQANPVAGLPTYKEWLRNWVASHGTGDSAKRAEMARRICHAFRTYADPAIRAKAAGCPRGDR